jgi:hypothetical protein
LIFFRLFRKENRFDILLYECMLLGFCIGFISIYHHITFVLILLLLIHIIGTLYTEKRLNIIPQGINSFIHISFELFRLLINRFYRFILNHIFRRSPPKVLITKRIPQQYLYNYHLKPTNDLQLQQV